MSLINESDTITLLLGIGVILVMSRISAEIMKRLKTSVIIGEIMIGIILGPSILGNLFPEISGYIFPKDSDSLVRIGMDAIIMLSVVMLLFIAGLEVQLNVMIEQRKNSMKITLFNIIIPILTGIASIWLFPDIFNLFNKNNSDIWLSGAIIGSILCITALPVIARIMIEMGIFKSKIGMTIISSVMFIDIIGWLIFSILISLTKSNIEESHQPVLYTVAYVFAFGFFMLTIGIKIINFILPWIEKKLSWPGGFLALSLGFCFLGAAFAQYIGIHSILGSFIMGVAIGNSEHIKSNAVEIIQQFIDNIFTPIFFVSIGLYIDFFEFINIKIILILVAISYFSKVLGTKMGLRITNISKRKHNLVSVAMTMHGTSEIILAAILLKNDIIKEELFVSIILMVIISIIISSFGLKYFSKKIK